MSYYRIENLIKSKCCGVNMETTIFPDAPLTGIGQINRCSSCHKICEDDGSRDHFEEILDSLQGELIVKENE